MLLAIDVGNTNTVLGCFWKSSGQLNKSPFQKTWRISTHPIGTADEFRAKLDVLFRLEGIDFKAFVSVVVSSVVPSFSGMLKNAFKGTPIHFIDHHTPFSFHIKADPASQVGADRLVNAEAVIREYGYPAIIVDSGTATTLCAVSRDKEYLGGAIMPGIELSIETLAKNTAKLFTVELVPPKKAIGTNTQEALRSGLLFGYAEMVDGMVRRFKAEMGEPDAKVIATGGISELLRGIMKQPDHIDPDLTLKGIAALYDAISSR